MTLKLLQDVTAEPLTLSVAKAQGRITSTDEDSLIESYITASREYVQSLSGRSIGEQQYELTLDELDTWIELLRPPIVSVDSVTVDGDPFTDYKLDGAVLLPQSFPDGEVVITYTTGTPIPQVALVAMSELVTHWFENRTPVINEGTPRSVPHTTDRLIRIMRVWSEY